MSDALCPCVLDPTGALIGMVARTKEGWKARALTWPTRTKPCSSRAEAVGWINRQGVADSLQLGAAAEGREG